MQKHLVKRYGNVSVTHSHQVADYNNGNEIGHRQSFKEQQVSLVTSHQGPSSAHLR